MNWKFWETEPVKAEVKSEPKRGSFLFATSLNYLKVLSIERKENCTEVVFRSKVDTFEGNAYHRYDLSIEQHEDFIAKISKDIECVVVPAMP